MESETEPAKLLLPYLQRADELQKHEPLVAYYCRLYAMERGLKIPPKERTKTTSALLVSLMNQLEKDKKSVKLGPEDNLYVEGFASSVFAKADKQDRAGRADLNTAKTFYAASIFFEILNQFGELQPDMEQKQKYAIWKAADIRKALKEGRRPEPGPPGGDKDLSIQSSTPTSTYDLGPNDSFHASQPGVDTSLHHVNKVNLQPSGNTPTSPSSYSSPDHPSGDFHQAPPLERSEISAYPQPYHHQSYSTEQQSMPQNYTSHENLPQNYPFHEAAPQNYPSHESSGPSHSFANFQSYPSFNDNTLPTVPSHRPTYYCDNTYSHQSAQVPNYPPTTRYDSGSGNGTKGSGNGTKAGHSAPSAANFTYDSNYQPPVDKIAEAHKAARFAVGALAFEDVPVAVEFLRRSLELLTNPSAETH